MNVRVRARCSDELGGYAADRDLLLYDVPAMDDDKYAEYVVRALREIGISGDRVPETSERRPDITAQDGTHNYVVEVKTRNDDEGIERELRATGTAYRISPIAWTNTVARIFADALEQLDALESPGSLKLVWVCILSQRGADETLADQIRHTLFGVELVAGDGLPRPALPCYYFHDSVFFRYPQLAGVVIDTRRGRLLCVNNHSGAAAELRQSRLRQAFQSDVIDPAEKEQAGSCLIADCSIPRNEADRVLAYVSEKYGITHAVHFNLDEHSAMSVVDTGP